LASVNSSLAPPLPALLADPDPRRLGARSGQADPGYSIE